MPTPPARTSRAIDIEQAAPRQALAKEFASRAHGGAVLMLEHAGGDSARLQASLAPGAGALRRSELLAADRMFLVPDYPSLEALVRRGTVSERALVVGDDGLEESLRRAAAALRNRQRPLPAAPFDPGARCLVVLPTYNEASNLAAITTAILQHLRTDVLVVDDGSPDGTGGIADELAQRHAQVQVLHRQGKLGLGTAYLAGFARAIEAGYDFVFEMDADFSHPPWDLPRLAYAAPSCDLVIGSRYVRGGRTDGWVLRRRLLSRGANLYARMFLGLGIRDMTAGFRCYRVAALARLDLANIAAQGYAFQIEMAYRCLRAGFVVQELPIRFVDRAAGISKMDGRIAREALLLVPRLRFR